MKKILLIFSITSIIFFISCTNSIETEPIELPSLDEQIGQMLIIGFRGTTISEDDQIASDIKTGRIGGVVLYDRDVALQSNVRNIESPAQVTNLISSLQSYSKEKLFIAIDQEGGFVNRLKEKYGFPKTVSQQYLGELNNIDSTKYYANRTASLLKTLGINFNFAPVVDLNINPQSPAIGNIERSFSADPDIVVSHSKIIIDSHHDYNVMTILKHFPGHGSAASDSHQGFTDVTNTWQNVELKPYEDLIASGYKDAIMTAHIFNANLDPQYPATLSNKIITGILRNQIGFNGVIISDDMNMGAIADHYGLETAIELGINAGLDILIFANNLTYDPLIAEKATAVIKTLVSQNKISTVRINDSYQRIMRLKEKILF